MNLVALAEMNFAAFVESIAESPKSVELKQKKRTFVVWLIDSLTKIDWQHKNRTVIPFSILSGKLSINDN